MQTTVCCLLFWTYSKLKMRTLNPNFHWNTLDKSLFFSSTQFMGLSKEKVGILWKPSCVIQSRDIQKRRRRCCSGLSISHFNSNVTKYHSNISNRCRHCLHAFPFLCFILWCTFFKRYASCHCQHFKQYRSFLLYFHYPILRLLPENQRYSTEKQICQIKYTLQDSFIFFDL